VSSTFPKKSEIFQRPIAHVQETLKRPSLDSFYQVHFDFSKLGNWLPENIDYGRTQGLGLKTKMSLMCAEAEIPGTSYMTTQTTGHRQGIVETFPTLRQFPPLNLSFYLDAEHVILEVLETWMKFINPIEEGMESDKPAYSRFAYPEDYKEILHITKFERNLKEHSRLMNTRDPNKTQLLQNNPASKISQYKFFEVWPTNMTSMRVKYGQSDVLRLSVQLAYDRYISQYNVADNQTVVQDTPDMINRSNDIRNDPTLGMNDMINYSAMGGIPVG